MDKLRVLKFDSQYAVNPLEKNVLAVGLASGFIEPLEATSIYLIQYYIETFGKIVNTGRNPAVYNKTVHRLTREMYEFVLTNYTLTKRSDSEYWRYFQDLESKLNTKQFVLERAAQPDTGEWSGTKLFFPFNWWSKAHHFGLYA
jgi:tryptophan halogenase